MRFIIEFDDREVAQLAPLAVPPVTRRKVFDPMVLGRDRLAEMVGSANGRPDAQGATVYFADEDETMTIVSMTEVPDGGVTA